MRFWLDRTATPLPSHSAQRTSRTLGSRPLLVDEGDDGTYVLLLDDVQRLRTVDEDAVQHIQDTYKYTCSW